MKTSGAGKRRPNPSGWPSPRTRPAIKCHAHKTNGEPCPNFAMHAQAVCHAHGGRSQQALAAAQVRIAQAAYARAAERAAVRALKRRAKQARWAAGILGRPEHEIDSAAIEWALVCEAWERAAASLEKPAKGRAGAA